MDKGAIWGIRERPKGTGRARFCLQSEDHCSQVSKDKQICQDPGKGIPKQGHM